MDLELFEGEVPKDLVCGLCQKVVVNPLQTSCGHLFCKACLGRGLKDREREREKGKAACPTCKTPVKGQPQEPSVDVKMKLLSLPVHCSHQCGKVCTLAELPDHVGGEECPNVPVTCPYTDRGCRMTVRRVEVGEHAEECDYRYVDCEACGQRTLYMDLFTHQSRKRCVEMKLRQQLNRAVKITNTEVKQHKRYLERQHQRVEQQRKRFLERQRHIQNTTATPPRRANLQPHNMLTYSNHNHHTTNSNNHPGNHTRPGTEMTTFDPHHALPPHRDVFLTSSKGAEGEEGVVERTVTFHTLTSPSRCSAATTTMATCKKCGRRFNESFNSPNSCRWHPGPIIELFGGTCFACGRLDYQKGCMMGCHEL